MRLKAETEDSTTPKRVLLQTAVGEGWGKGCDFVGFPKLKGVASDHDGKRLDSKDSK